MKNWFKSNKRKLLPFAGVFLLAGALITYYVYTSPFDGAGMSGSQGSHASSGTLSTARNVPVEQENPFNHKKALNEVHVVNYIHWMSHQKVKAESKWTHYEMTPERIDWLLEKVQEADYKHEDVYVEILTKWQKGDFSRADVDHNRVWSLLNGTVGKATGVMTEEEEKEYLKNPTIKFK